MSHTDATLDSLRGALRDGLAGELGALPLGGAEGITYREANHALRVRFVQPTRTSGNG